MSDVDALRAELEDLRLAYKQALATIEQVTRTLDDMERLVISATGRSPREKYRVDL